MNVDVAFSVKLTFLAYSFLFQMFSTITKVFVIFQEDDTGEDFNGHSR